MYPIRDPDTGEIIASTYQPMSYDEYDNILLQDVRCIYEMHASQCEYYPNCLGETNRCSKDPSK